LGSSWFDGCSREPASKIASSDCSGCFPTAADVAALLAEPEIQAKTWIFEEVFLVGGHRPWECLIACSLINLLFTHFELYNHISLQPL
jgi:hypothetical protein